MIGNHANALGYIIKTSNRTSVLFSSNSHNGKEKQESFFSSTTAKSQMDCRCCAIHTAPQLAATIQSVRYQTGLRGAFIYGVDFAPP